MSPIPELQALGGSVWIYIMVADLPISFVAYGLAWQHGGLAATWIVVAGTLWWYFLSRGAEVAFNTFMSVGNLSILAEIANKMNRETTSKTQRTDDPKK
jgi:hypothetical protein